MLKLIEGVFFFAIWFFVAFIIAVGFCRAADDGEDE